MNTKWIFSILQLLVISQETFGEEKLFECLNVQAKESLSIGVLLEPYKITANGSKDGVLKMLNLLADRGFRSISTLAVKQTTNQVRAAIIPAVTQFNSVNNDSRTLSLYPAFSMYKTTSQKDITDMITVVDRANNQSLKTIKRVVIYARHDLAVNHFKNINITLTNLKANLSTEDFPPLGISSKNCLKNVQDAEKTQSWGIFQHIGFMICKQFPSQSNPPGEEANKVIEYMKSTKKILANASLNVEVIGMTGWKSKLNGNGVEGRELLRRFWCEIEKKSEESNITIHMFHAFETPPPLRSGEESNIRPPIYHIASDYGWWLPIINKETDTVVFRERVNYEEAKPISIWEIVVGSTAAFLILVFSLVITFLYYKLKLANSLLSAKEIEEFRNGVTEARTDADDLTEDALKLPYDTSYEIPKSKFQIEKAFLLGKGEFGFVYKGKLEGHEKEVAFKVTSPNITAVSLKNMLSEIKIMIHVGKHPNVVNIIGAHTGDISDGNVYIALEMCDLGSLESYLRKFREVFLQKDPTDSSLPNSPGCLSDTGNLTARYTAGPSLVKTFSDVSPESIVSQLHKWAHDIANGMEHIAMKHVIHSDLAARNVLLTSDKTAKITDFGLSRRLYTYTNYTKQSETPLPWRWMAIESLEEMSFSTKSDVWSFGVTLYELFSFGLLPYPGLSWTFGFTEELKSGKLIIPQPEYASKEIYSLMKTCWEINPKGRPDFTTLKESLSYIIESIELNAFKKIASIEEDPVESYYNRKGTQCSTFK